MICTECAMPAFQGQSALSSQPSPGMCPWVCSKLRNAHVLMTYEFESVTYLTHLYGWLLLCSLSICRYLTWSRDAQYIGIVNCRLIGPTPLLMPAPRASDSVARTCSSTVR